MEPKLCYFCGRDSRLYYLSEERATGYVCPSCGEYAVTNYLCRTINNQDAKISTSHLLAEYNLLNRKRLLITNSNHENIDNPYYAVQTHEDLLAHYPNNAIDIIDRSLLNLHNKIIHPADTIAVQPSDLEIFFSHTPQNRTYVINQLVKLDYISVKTGTNTEFINIEATGWKRIGELQKVAPGTIKQAFVAMWFHEEMQKVYFEGIKPAVESFEGWRAFRIDMVEHNNKICDQITAEVKKSHYLIADFTGGRGGVYFEAGLAQGLGLPVIWLVHEADVENLHFDTRQYNHIVYTDAEDLFGKLKARIDATIIKH